jgi:hypothetical protein
MPQPSYHPGVLLPVPFTLSLSQTRASHARHCRLVGALDQPTIAYTWTAFLPTALLP